VNALRRKGALAPGAFGTLTWEREGDVQTSVDFRADSAGIVLSYGDHNGEAPRAVEQHVALSSVPAAFGGSRTYFLCPGAGCGQRNSILYFFARGSFAAGAAPVWLTKVTAKIRCKERADAPISSARD
jgi:hypothetical protein